MTDQRNRVTTDPGLGPVEREHASTLRSITAADPIPEDEIPGTSVYFEPKPLHAVSEHKTLELETVKLAKDIDPRKLPTELKLRRPVLHVLPASDPNWPVPLPQANVVVQHDSNWPPPETTLTTSQFPVAGRRRSFVPLVMLVLFGATAVLVLGARARHRSSAIALAAPPPQPVQAALPVAVPSPEPESSEPAAGELAPEASASSPSADSVESPTTVASAAALASAEPTPNAAPATPHHAPLKAAPPANANSPAANAPSTAKPKRAIY